MCEWACSGEAPFTNSFSSSFRQMEKGPFISLSNKIQGVSRESNFLLLKRERSNRTKLGLKEIGNWAFTIYGFVYIPIGSLSILHFQAAHIHIDRPASASRWPWRIDCRVEVLSGFARGLWTRRHWSHQAIYLRRHNNVHCWLLKKKFLVSDGVAHCPQARDETKCR